MKFVCISDTHSRHRFMRHDMPEGDVLLHAGDFSMQGMSKEVLDFAEWINSLDYEYKIIIAGNHDVTFDPEKNVGYQSFVDHLQSLDRVLYLNKDFVYIDGIKIWGEPHQPEFFNWAFNTPREKMKYHWDAVPEDVDILLTHGPPHGYRDLAKDMNQTSIMEVVNGPKLVHVGCEAQKEFVLKSNIKHIVCGHIHEGYGSEKINNYDIMVHNASVCNGNYAPVNKPIVFEYEKN